MSKPIPINIDSIIYDITNKTPIMDISKGKRLYDVVWPIVKDSFLDNSKNYISSNCIFKFEEELEMAT
jgi:hypothetical protein